MKQLKRKLEAVEATWSKWEEEKPKWLDENIRTNIPVDYIPNVAEKKKRKEGTMPKSSQEVTTH